MRALCIAKITKDRVINTKPYGPEHFNEYHESDISSIEFTSYGFQTTIDTKDTTGTWRELQVKFSSVAGFRYLDEGDLRYYWDEGNFTSPYHVFRIYNGGWSNGESVQQGILQVSKATGISEWFIVTNNHCISVLSSANPDIDYMAGDA